MTDPQPTSHTIYVGGLKLHYLDWGNDGALPLILIHGLTGAAGDWRNIAAYYRETYHVIAIDQRGHGESDHAADKAYGTDDFVGDLEGSIDALGLDRVMLLGHSMGGHNTIAYTARNPERVRCALVNDMPPAFWFPNTPEERAKGYPDGQQPVFASVDAWVDSKREGSRFTSDEHHLLTADARLKQVDGGYAQKHDPNVAIHWDATDLWDEARTIERPIFFIRAGKSEILDAITVQRMNMEIHAARSIGLEQSTHSTYLDMEEEFLSASSQFFAAHND
ncbi:MAG TPA: alpha/beta hydrolase [Dehalococcoidia bacterium]|jgi:pimeloyl-ACP methyl ester carboxylesterase|nr:alpha/beta hydrolase [Dehalococcoidia bacterium]